LGTAAKTPAAVIAYKPGVSPARPHSPSVRRAAIGPSVAPHSPTTRTHATDDASVTRSHANGAASSSVRTTGFVPDRDRVGAASPAITVMPARPTITRTVGACDGAIAIMAAAAAGNPMAGGRRSAVRTLASTTDAPRDTAKAATPAATPHQSCATGKSCMSGRR
jgi:hypothetical protein